MPLCCVLSSAVRDLPNRRVDVLSKFFRVRCSLVRGVLERISLRKRPQVGRSSTNAQANERGESHTERDGGFGWLEGTLGAHHPGSRVTKCHRMLWRPCSASTTTRSIGSSQSEMSGVDMYVSDCRRRARSRGQGQGGLSGCCPSRGGCRVGCIEIFLELARQPRAAKPCVPE